ncbi:hypothetical protein B296_00034558 [Ensete ventricosum]|uniref:Uncharacterized protein n=1 Tax=Ensete ventricosum TaxID=4639 RepID=A0A426Z6Q3_ENSVE|nr:hypothetical protein B296_00034558 [Ensete ventricosum]
MRSCFNINSTVTTHRLVEIMKNYYIPSEYKLHVPLPGERPYDAFPNDFSLSIDALEAGLSFPTELTSRTVNNSVPTLSTNEIELVEILRRILSASRRMNDMNEAWLAETGLSPAPRESPLKRGKGRWRSRRPRAGYTIRDLCEVEDHAGTDRYFASIMMRLKTVEGEDPLVPRWLAIFGSTQVWTDGLLAAEYLRGGSAPRPGKASVLVLLQGAYEQGRQLMANQELVTVAEHRVKQLQEDVKKLRAELESLKNQRKELEQEVYVLRSSLDGACDDQARLEGDVMSLTKMTTLLKAEGRRQWTPTRHLEDSSRASRRWGGSATSSGTEWRSNDCEENIQI